MASLPRRLLLTAVASAIALAAGEFGARKLYGSGFASVVDVYEHHPYRAFAHYRDTNGREVVTNELGWKDAAARRVAKKSPGIRVVVLGDSFVEGLGLADEETIPRIAERTLRRRGHDVEVLNGGRVSFSPLLEYQRLKRFLAAGYQTNYVVVLPDVSDVQDELSYAEQFTHSSSGEPLRLRGAIENPLLRGAYNHSALLRSLRRIQQAAVGRALPAAALPAGSSETERQRAHDELAKIAPDAVLDEIDQMSGTTLRVLRANWMLHPPSLRGWAGRGLRSLVSNLQRIGTLCRREQISMVVVVYPWPQMVYGSRDLARYSELRNRFGSWFLERELVADRQPSPAPTAYETAILAACDHLDAKCVTVVDEFRAVPQWERLFQPGDIHLSPAGNRLVADAIVNAVSASS